MGLTRAAIVLLFFALACAFNRNVIAQSSSSYALDGHAFNNGGDPAGGVVVQSASFRISLDAIGDAIGGTAMGSASFAIRGGTGPAIRPPGEVLGLRFNSPNALAWNIERSAGSYNLYRGPQGDFVGSGFGACEQQDLTSTTTTVTGSVPAGSGYFYLVTVESILGEEGTKGFRSSGAMRPNAAPCP